MLRLSAASSSYRILEPTHLSSRMPSKTSFRPSSWFVFISARSYSQSLMMSLTFPSQGYYFWRVAFRFSLPSFQSHALERTVWYLAPFWCGVLLNIVTEKIQIDRLGGTDITGKAIGTFTALIIVIVILAGWQISVMWRTGWLPFYFRW